ncbi:MAG: hypothetical protein A3E57_05900 [Candidatus Muproteobacteria bacterium RIFCSPHIGHO2_12_FULL_60_33]|uniref:Uncharacterized protein n=1 Tax=Candidatus Muproteobacteria bacterium RIFCSPLOWO2_01_FULL_60_18 TaxID=1817768 RepID=A0A1F6TYS5_9PROT|nr:MAG: hypothetical protein A3A87_09830 [Candidatus Muproteobacteria bacterium RIFCSPLOWO2_01_FULL_60_18]OGI52532.1 MAG: hypothetical protein A2W42_09035 [Candidatus Muproteobacteria bacterium RIFCSPHIGHO2_01_60_12]OGI53948.1 MAG: hypothetical protein A3E57_05900 [Candidatus Muproteobacteria bacterium RIFCSPHIGHO2_12_FULL_60_33]OGI56944.1 MAG: hypothetical protein A3D32_02530 [Candidatus Muproteobacteria bacterium RIFCSPHIGHO2_02_FULL_60_13]OGI57781.1 MAG: hypothetical protein A2809_06865 [Can
MQGVQCAPFDNMARDTRPTSLIIEISSPPPRRGRVKEGVNLTLPLALFPPGVHENHVHPLGGEKIHQTFSCFRLAPSREGEDFYYRAATDSPPSREGKKFHGAFCVTCG